MDCVSRWIWNLLKSPAKRETCEKITSGNVCPLPYCKARLCVNKETAKRAAVRGFQFDNPIVPFFLFYFEGIIAMVTGKICLERNSC